MIRRATVEDVKDIQRLVNSHAEKGEMLPRSLGDTCDNIRDFFVYEEGGVILGCCALHVTWVDLAKIKSLAVAEKVQGQGMGKDLLDACLEDARRLAIKKVFALTYYTWILREDGLSTCRKGGIAS